MKLYNRAEISAILKKAADNSSNTGTDPSIGMSVNELKQLATDTGIDPDEIVKAIEELESDHKYSKRTFMGGPFSFNSQTLVDGEITAAQWEEMLISIRHSFGSNGDVSSRESVHEWSSPQFDTNSANITAFKNAGNTKLSISWKGPFTALPYYIPVPIAAIVALLFASEYLGLSAFSGFAFTAAATGLTFLTGRWAVINKLNSIFKGLRKTLSDLENIARGNGMNKVDNSSQLDTTEALEDRVEPLIHIREEENVTEDDINTSSKGRSKA